jgi:hypothetical protein
LSAVDSASARIKELENEMGDGKAVTAAGPGVGSP